VPNSSWFAIGFGEKMKDTDMIAWSAQDNFSNSIDMYSTGYGVPSTDAQNNVETTFTDD